MPLAAPKSNRGSRRTVRATRPFSGLKAKLINRPGLENLADSTPIGSGTPPVERTRIKRQSVDVEPDRLGLNDLAAIGLKPHVDATFPLEEAARAHELGEQGRTRGKIVLTI